MRPIPLIEIPLFAGLSGAAKIELQSTCTLRKYGAGDIILKAGEPGAFLFAIALGTVSVRPAFGQREFPIVLGPSEVFGEMSLLSALPASATVIAERETQIYLVTADIFDRFFAIEPAFRKGIADLLAERLRLRTSRKGEIPTCVFIGLQSSANALRRALVRAVDHYAAVFETGHYEDGTQCADALAKEIDSWRASAHIGEVCIAALPTRSIGELRAHMRPGDAVLLVDDGTSAPDLASVDHAIIDVAMVRIGTAAFRPAKADDVWSYRLQDAEMIAAENVSEWSRHATPVLDAIARWMTRRTIGIALGVGVARGFAHLGVLGILDAAGIPIDCLSGSSIGGIVALLYAMTGSAEVAYDLARLTLGSTEVIRDLSIIPRSAVFRGDKVRRSAERVSAGKYLPDLTRPAFTVAADLITGERVVLDKGLVATAFLATAAIPGVFPPVKAGDRWLVDGALVNRVPVDLLDRWRCGFKIAVNVTDIRTEGTELHAELRRAINSRFGLARVITRSWELLGLAHGAAEAQAADIIVIPHTHLLSGHDFGAINCFVAAGKAAAEQELPSILESVNKALRPRPR
jgi:NTE family protein